MFFRRKAVGGRTYLQIVESRRDGSSIRQHVVATLGRTEDWLDGGKLDQLLQSGARLSETALVLSALRDGDGLVVDSRRLGPPLIFERLWRETGCQAVIEGLLAERQFQFPVERAIFASVLHRLCISGSDRACDKWLEGYRLGGLDGIDLHHLYRAIAWLGEELADQEGRTRAPRAIKDLVEERLFARRRDLFNDLDLVFFDTSALYFHGEGGETLGRRGKSKDHRPELKQVVIGVVIDRHGRPLCSETWPGNAPDVQALLPVIDRLRARFCIGRICVVADRGMISARTLAELEARGIEYILGTRERNDAEVRETVLADTTGMVPLSIPKAAGTTTEIEVKEVLVRPWDGKGKSRRYVVCYNPERAAWGGRPADRDHRGVAGTAVARSITPVTPLSAATCSAASWRWCCARNCRTGCRRPNWISSGRTSSPTSTASSRPPSNSRDVASCCATKRPAVPDQCSRPLVSPCRPCSDASTQKNPPRPPARPARNPASAASHPVRVVPRRPRKTESTNQINKFRKSGVTGAKARAIRVKRNGF